MPYSIYQSPSLSIAGVSLPWSALIFSNSAGLHQRDSRASHATFPGRNCSFPWAPSQALISQRPSSTSSYRVRHHSSASPEREIVAIVTWSSKGARTALIKVLFHAPEVFEPWHFESRWMAVVPGLKCVWSRQVRHSVHKPETYLHSKLLNLNRLAYFHLIGFILIGSYLFLKESVNGT